MSAPRKILPENVEIGDTIAVYLEKSAGVRNVRIGRVAEIEQHNYAGARYFFTAEGGIIASYVKGNGDKFYLIDAAPATMETLPGMEQYA